MSDFRKIMQNIPSVFDSFENEYERVVERAPVYGTALAEQDFDSIEFREDLESPMYTSFNEVVCSWWMSPRITKKVVEVEILNEELR